MVTSSPALSSLLSRRLDLRALLLEGRAFLALLTIVVVFSVLSPNYLTVDNVLQMSQHVAVFAILSVGMLAVILNGGIDLSVGSTLGLSGVVAGYLMQGVHIPALDLTLYPSVPAVVIITLVTGALIGVVNGVLVARFNVAPFVATLGMLYALRGIALLITDGLTYSNLQGREDLGNTGFSWLGFNSLFGVPVGVWVMIVVAGAGWFLLSRTAFGRWLYASGGNERAAELSGIPIRTVKIRAYVISAVCASIAGMITASELTSASPNAGNMFELTAIAAVVIGGAALTGGRGTIRGTMLGAFVIGFLSDGLVIVGVSEYWQTVFTGAVIILAVLLNAVQYRPRRKQQDASGASEHGPSESGPTPTKERNTDVSAS
ncbi:ABC transporter permease [Actinomadura sp. WMMB 499]|uniref:ABC transporter permease n=1 Tax=Actinomadura sp. WMMB 499 TaxID=1219491 RepID=UPI001243D875|nr:ABC transporter permease [Actinomadura sp. WMMB 499]QFG26263.1 ABC transporter permease [Actinomadura sp. WMMB 499]